MEDLRRGFSLKTHSRCAASTRNSAATAHLVEAAGAAGARSGHILLSFLVPVLVQKWARHKLFFVNCFSPTETPSVLRVTAYVTQALAVLAGPLC